jgi:hypothetical protein
MHEDQVAKKNILTHMQTKFKLRAKQLRKQYFRDKK